MSQTHCLMSPAFQGGIRVLQAERVHKIGRGPQCDLLLTHEAVSRVHCTLEWRDGVFVVVDKSANGTYINGQKMVMDTPLADEDVVVVGPFQLRYRLFAGSIAVAQAEAELQCRETVGPGQTPLIGGSAAFGGAFKGMDLVELCQFLNFNAKDGVLWIRGGQFEGEIEFRGGDVVDAKGERCAESLADDEIAAWARGEDLKIQPEALQGLPAARRLLQQSTGMFSFEPGAPTDKPTLIATQKLLVDLMRELDETQIR